MGDLECWHQDSPSEGAWPWLGRFLRAPHVIGSLECTSHSEIACAGPWSE